MIYNIMRIRKDSRKDSNMKQKMTVPSYIKDFKCIAGACEETCCAGWYIAIDETTYKKYKKVKHPEMKKRFEKELVVKKGSSPECMAKIKLKNNRCAFLAKDNLCDIYKNLGEQYLSETCTMYPRIIPCTLMSRSSTSDFASKRHNKLYRGRVYAITCSRSTFKDST